MYIEYTIHITQGALNDLDFDLNMSYQHIHAVFVMNVILGQNIVIAHIHTLQQINLELKCR